MARAWGLVGQGEGNDVWRDKQQPDQRWLIHHTEELKLGSIKRFSTQVSASIGTEYFGV